MVERCDGCAAWLTVRKTLYSTGEEVVHFQAAPGMGGCKALGIDTAADFGCAKFAPGDDHVEILARKVGAPWQHSHAGPCPDCAGKGNQGDSGCHRCAGTGRVRHYDDGYIGEERTRLHPKEREQTTPLTCQGCGAVIEREWVACPRCGKRTEAPAVTEIVPLVDQNVGGPL